jgi:hypothetical protein
VLLHIGFLTFLTSFSADLEIPRAPEKETDVAQQLEPQVDAGSSTNATPPVEQVVPESGKLKSKARSTKALKQAQPGPKPTVRRVYLLIISFVLFLLMMRINSNFYLRDYIAKHGPVTVVDWKNILAAMTPEQKKVISFCFTFPLRILRCFF